MQRGRGTEERDGPRVWQAVPVLLLMNDRTVTRAVLGNCSQCLWLPAELLAADSGVVPLRAAQPGAITRSSPDFKVDVSVHAGAEPLTVCVIGGPGGGQGSTSAWDELRSMVAKLPVPWDQAGCSARG